MKTYSFSIEPKQNEGIKPSDAPCIIEYEGNEYFVIHNDEMVKNASRENHISVFSSYPEIHDQYSFTSDSHVAKNSIVKKGSFNFTSS